VWWFHRYRSRTVPKIEAQFQLKLCKTIDTL
jgi:hypothetical protein